MKLESQKSHNYQTFIAVSQPLSPIYVNQGCMLHPDQLCAVRINFSLSIEIDVPDSLTAHSYIIDTSSSYRICGFFYLDLAPSPSLSNERF
jgi:hypothetical protein